MRRLEDRGGVCAGGKWRWAERSAAGRFLVAKRSGRENGLYLLGGRAIRSSGGVLTACELALRWRASVQTIQRMARRGDLCAVKIAGRWLVAEAEWSRLEQPSTRVGLSQRAVLQPPKHRPQGGRAALSGREILRDHRQGRRR